ncbi:SDR family oxidoreductase [Streptomyces sp. NPDC054796]
MRDTGTTNGASGTVVMTGATGFLGSHVLAGMLLRNANTSVVALTRQEPGLAAARLATALRATGVPLPRDLRERVSTVRADLTDPHLGLSSRAYRELARHADSVWHMAGDIRLVHRPSALDRVNVEGTRHMLRFAATAPRRPHLLHTSTAYVAGALTHGHVAEDDIGGGEGFLTEYEGSKHRAERLVRGLAKEVGGGVTVFRPSVLTDHRPPRPGAPRGPHSVLAARLAMLGRRLPALPAARSGAVRDGVLTARMPGDPDAHMNILPVQDAAETMLHIGLGQAAASRAGGADRGEGGGGVTTYHVVHPRQTPVQSLLEALTHHTPWLRLRLDGEGRERGYEGRGRAGGARRSSLERALMRESAGVAAYACLHRTYDRSRCTALGAPEPRPLDASYLRASFAPPSVN